MLKPSLLEAPLRLVFGDEVARERASPAATALELVLHEGRSRPVMAAGVSAAVWGIPRGGHQVLANDAHDTSRDILEMKMLP